MKWHARIPKRITYTLLLLGVLSTSPILSAQTVQEKTLDHLIELSNFSGMILQSNRNMRPLFDSQAEEILKSHLGVSTLNVLQKEASLKISQLLQKTNEDLVTDEKMLQLIRKHFQNTYSEEEAQAYIQFLSTPIGQSINSKSAIMLNNMMQETLSLSTEMMNNPKRQQQFNLKLTRIIQPLMLNN